MDRRSRGRRRAVAVAREAQPTWWLWAMLAAGLLGVAPVWGQTVPEVVKPQSDAPSLPPGSSSGGAPRPRSENPLVGNGGARPIPDNGVVAPPVAGITPVIRPPQGGSMPVISPPGSPGGDRSVVPK